MRSLKKVMGTQEYIPNTITFDADINIQLITGPNMSGKSTYMRQVALITLMAQIGCFVPADYAKISVVDQIFTRIGASDDLTAGQSTFMVEMSEVADIVKHATKNSLVILDEVGRGTSTFDGISMQGQCQSISPPTDQWAVRPCLQHTIMSLSALKKSLTA